MRKLSRFKVSKLSHVFLFLFVVTIIFSGVISLKLALLSNGIFKKIENQTLVHAKTPVRIIVNPTPLPTATETATETPTPTVFIPTVTPDTSLWGKAKQVDEHTWTMKVGEDTTMATAEEIYQALNTYRAQKGRGQLTLDEKLADFAKERANTFNSIQKLDGHTGFNEYVKSEENIKNLGFWGLGENSSFGFRMHGVHLIEWVFAGDQPHDDNQLDSSWTHVGIGVSGTGVDVVFGKEKI